MWCGDFPATFTAVPILFTTHAATGAPVAPSTAFEVADIVLFKDGSDVERTSQSGWTMTSPFNTTTGLHRLLIDLTDNTHAGFYAAGHVYTVVLAPDETVDSLAVVRVIGQFSIDMDLRPTTAGRTLDVTATGAAGVDWGNVENPTATVGLSGTTVKTATDVATDTTTVLARLTAARSANMDYLGNLDAPVSTRASMTLAQITTVVNTAVGGLTEPPALADIVTALTTALSVTTYPEPSAVPAADASIVDKLAWVCAILRNTVVQTASEQSVLQDGTVTPIASSVITVDTGVSMTRGQWSTA